MYCHLQYFVSDTKIELSQGKNYPYHCFCFSKTCLKDLKGPKGASNNKTLLTKWTTNIQAKRNINAIWLLTFQSENKKKENILQTT